MPIGELKPDNRDQLKDNIIEIFAETGFQIEQYLDIFSRILELANMTNSHFEDAVKMAEIVKFLWPQITEKLDLNFSLEQMQLACLFHDIGKSGPAEADPKQRKIVEMIFDPTKFDVNSAKFLSAPEFQDKSFSQRKKLIKDLSIRRILEIEQVENIDEVIDYLQTLKIHTFNLETKKIDVENLDVDKHPIILLWREHDYWTRKILKKYLKNYQNAKITRLMIEVASTHHTLEGHYPSAADKAEKSDTESISPNEDVPDEAVYLETIDKYSIITLVDKYQAFIDRELVTTHEQVIDILEKMIQDSKTKGMINHDDTQFRQFTASLGIIRDHAELFDLVKPKY